MPERETSPISKTAHSSKSGTGPWLHGPDFIYAGSPEVVSFSIEDAALLEAALSFLTDGGTDGKLAEAQDLLNRLEEMRHA